jgi:hypothetical protein
VSNGHAQRRPDRRADHAEPDALHQIDGKPGAAARAEAAQHRDGRDLLFDVDMHRARHAHRAEKQRDKSDQTQKRINVLQRRPELPFALFDGVELEARALESLLHCPGEGVAVHARQQLQVHAVPGESVLLQQTGRLHRRRRDEHPRRKQRDHRRVARNFFQRARHLEGARAKPHFVPHLHAELHEERFLEQGRLAVGQLRQRARGRRHQLAEERKSARHRDELDQLPLAGAFREIELGGKRHLRRHFAADAAKILHGLLVKRLARRDREIGAEEGLRLQLDRATQVFAHRPDARERGDSEDDRQGEQRQPPPRSPRIPPGHFEDEIHREGVPTKHTNDTKIRARSAPIPPLENAQN